MFDLFRPIFTNVWYVVLIALFFGGTIFVHELGHFLAARRRGLKVDRFSIGFGPKIFSWTRNGVEYRLSWIPLGGYVALPQLADMRGIEGEPATETERLPPISYTDKMIVSVMGAVFNLAFAFLLACVLWVIKQPQRADQITTTIGYVSPTIPITGVDGSITFERSPAVEAGLAIGDRVVSIDGMDLRDWDDLRYAVFTGKGRTADGRRLASFVVERDGQLVSLEIHPRLTGDEAMRTTGIAADYDVIVAAVPEGTSAKTIGLQPGDVLVSLNGTLIRNEGTYADLLAKTPEKPHSLVVRRGVETKTLAIPPRPGLLAAGVEPESPADKLGLKANDYLRALDGKPLTDRQAFVLKLRGAPEASFDLEVQRGETVFHVKVPPRPKDEGRLGIALGFTLGEMLTVNDELVRLNPVRQFQRIVANTFSTLATLIDPRSDIGLSKMNGPIGIISIYYDAVRAEIRFVLWLTVLININLAIFNLLPIPVLDGGHMLFATIAKLRGRALSVNFLMTAQSVFMALILTMFLYISFFDARRQWRSIFRSEPPLRQQPAPEKPETAPPAPAPSAPAPVTP